MKLTSIGSVVARREFTHADGGKVEIQIGMPVLFPDGHEMHDGRSHYCPFSITGRGPDYYFYGVGVDSLDALRAAMQMLVSSFEASDVCIEGKLSWFAGANGDLGLEDLK